MCAVGEVPLEWYKDELHVGYDREGRKVLRGPRRDRMDRLLAQADGGAGWRTVYDEYNGEEIVLSKDEFRMIQRIREGRFPHVEVNTSTWISLHIAVYGATTSKGSWLPPSTSCVSSAYELELPQEPTSIGVLIGCFCVVLRTCLCDSARNTWWRSETSAEHQYKINCCPSAG